AGGAVAVVGQTLDEQRDTVGAVALVGDGLPVGTAGFLTAATLAGTLDVVVRDRVLLRLLDGVEQGRVTRRVATAGPSRHLDVLDELRAHLAALGIDDRLLVLGGGPFGVAAHSLRAPSGEVWSASTDRSERRFYSLPVWATGTVAVSSCRRGRRARSAVRWPSARSPRRTGARDGRR